MLEDRIISVETAELAKEKGFNEEVGHYYSNNDLINPKHSYNFNLHNENIDISSAPTQSLLQKWLREFYKLHVRVDNVNRPQKNKWCFEIYKLPSGVINLWNETSKVYNSYEDALEIGLQEALKLI